MSRPTVRELRACRNDPRQEPLWDEPSADDAHAFRTILAVADDLLDFCIGAGTHKPENFGHFYRERERAIELIQRWEQG
jgi:hypothetical protein